ncbi:MAG: hypothetical protein ACODAB_01120 [Gemmatimonadota bacterium]
MSKRQHAGEAPGDSLDRLLEAEARIDERVRACRAEATRLVDEVRAEVERRERGLEAQLRDEQAELTRRAEAELADTIRAERDRAAREIERLRSLTSGQIDSLARMVIKQLLAEDAA